MSFRHGVRCLSLLVVLAITATVGFVGVPQAGAETVSVPATITVSPRTGLTDGSSITVHAEALSGYSLFGLTARLCAASATIDLASDFAPTQSGNCIKDPLSAGSDAKVAVFADASNLTADLTFKVGVGQETFTTQDSGSATIGCGPTESACKLVLELNMSGTGGSGTVNGKVYKSYPLTYAGTPVAPDAPTNVIAVAGNQSAVVTWDLPASDGGHTITAYQVTSSTGNKTCTWSAGPLTCTVTGLTNNSAYTFTVTATNDIGTSPASSASNSVTPVPPATVPGAPTGVTGVGGNAKATISWIAPASNGGAAITGYTVTSRGPVGSIARTCVTSTTSCTVTGLTNGSSYTFTVKATNSVGSSAASTASATIIPNTTVPGAPTSLVGTVGNGQVSFTWAAPLDNGGASITSYTVTALSSLGFPLVPAKTCSPASVSTRTCTITGLTNGTDYKFQVKATNVRGTSLGSTQTGLLRPRTVPSVPRTVSATVGAAGSKSVTVRWTAPLSSGGVLITGYTVTSSVGNRTCTAAANATSCVVTGLTIGTSYTFTVKATNAAGSSAASAASAVVTAR